jgi:tetratricopeptide (TPR) repeat protein
MKQAITLTGLAIFLCACASSHKSTASIQGLTPQQADKMNSEHAVVKEAKTPPVTANTRFALGQVAESQGDFDAAIHQYHRALELDPKHLASLCRLGVVYAKQKNYDLSIETWKTYIAASNDAAFGYGNLGYCYELAGFPALAKQTYLKGISKDPKNAPCRTNYGIMLAHEGKIAEAIRMWNPVLTDAQMHYNLASLYECDGRKVEAKAEYQKALESDPNMIDARSRLTELQPNEYDK